uniref:Uncharacterized protein n=1 Tax=viral metagenome TaxID=1070528 RepID=A0A6M3LAD4_9ZZZZ
MVKFSNDDSRAFSVTNLNYLDGGFMAIGIIVKNGDKKGKISKENKAEWRNERRVKILAKKGYRAENIAAMMFTPENNIREQHVKKWLRNVVNEKEMKYNEHI